MSIHKANLIIDAINLIANVIDCTKSDSVFTISITIIVVVFIYNAPKIIKAIKEK